MPVLRHSFFRRLASLGAEARGISILDLLLAVLVLTVVLLAAAQQFGRYEQVPAPVSAEQATNQVTAEP